MGTVEGANSVEIQANTQQVRLLNVCEALNSLRPAMQADGGDVELVSVDGGVITVRLKGTCLACPSANLTLKYGIERTLKGSFSWVEEVIRVL